MAGLTAEDFNEWAKTGFQIGVAPVRIDMLHHIDGVIFDEAWENRTETFMDGDIPVHVISRDDLLKNKLESGRPRDLLDIDAIRDAADVERTTPSTADDVL